MKTKALIIGLVIIAIAAACVVVFVMLPGKDGEEVVKVPINAQSADDVGAIHIELAYDPAVLEATEVKAGTLAGNAMIEYHLDTTGWVVVSMVDSAGMNGEGSLAVVTFNVVGEDGATSALTLENLAAWDATNVFDMPVESTPGSFAGKARKLTAPVMFFNP